MSAGINEYIEDLFRYLETYEKKAASFETEAFFQTYNGISAVFQALRQQRDKAIAVDQFFLEKIQLTPLNSSDLRQITIQILITNFESEADVDGQSNRSYLYCRGLRNVKQDVPYFENTLAPLLFREGSLNNNSRLNAFLLTEMARIINTYGKRVQAGLTPEEFGAMSDPLKFLELARRRHALGPELLKDRTTLEFHLQRVDTFSRLREKSRLFEYYLMQWQYLATSSFWKRLRQFFSEAGAKLGGAFSSSRYTGLVMRQRNPAYFYYTLIILISIFLAIWIPMRWHKYNDTKLQQLQERAAQPPGTMSK
ncbi:MAG: hypothetical protein AB1644_09230 [Candidatus Zixiibacteriota bacterium]